MNYKDSDRNYTKGISCKIGSTEVLSRDYKNSRIYKQGVVRRHPLLSLQKNYVVHRILIGRLYMHRHLPLRGCHRTVCHWIFLPSGGCADIWLMGCTTAVKSSIHPLNASRGLLAGARPDAADPAGSSTVDSDHSCRARHGSGPPRDLAVPRAEAPALCFGAGSLNS